MSHRSSLQLPTMSNTIRIRSSWSLPSPCAAASFVIAANLFDSPWRHGQAPEYRCRKSLVASRSMGEVCQRCHYNRQTRTRSAVSGALSRIRSRARGAGGAALSLFPVADRLLRHVDAPRHLDLRQAQAATDAAGVPRHVPHGFRLVLPLLPGDLRFGGAIHHSGLDAPIGESGRIVGINFDACCAHSFQPL